MRNARIFHSVEHRDDNHNLLVFHEGRFRRWDGSSWPALDEDVLRAEIRRFFEHAYFMVREKGGLVRKEFKPTSGKVNEIVEALKAVTIEPNRDIPSWLDPAHTIPPLEVLPMSNGLLWVPHGALLPLTPVFFNSYALPYEFESAPTPPGRWLQFLDELFGDDTESIHLLQDFMGYMLMADTSLQKILLVVGPKRSGKGTIARVLRALLGEHNVAGPTMSGLCTNFGLQPLVDKPAAIISDARLGNGRDSATAVERLLSISGEDPLTVDVKYKAPYTVKLPTRLIIMTNEVPALMDSSGALASRFLTLRLTESFYDREDPGLLTKLLPELPGILVWAMEGRQRLYERGFFVQPESGEAIIDDFIDLSSPVTAFVEERCVLGPNKSVAKAALFDAWRDWCGENNATVGSKRALGIALRAAFPHVGNRRGSDSDRKWEYTGIGLGR